MITDEGYSSNYIMKLWHMSRFNWLNQRLTSLCIYPNSVLELGCNTGKLIDLIKFKPNKYCGFDVDEKYLNIAKERWSSISTYSFRLCKTPDEMIIEDEKYDISIVMETLEYIHPMLLNEYLLKLKEHTREYIFITVPNQKGIPLLVKLIISKIIGNRFHIYSISELYFAIIGKMNKVNRRERKGFDYAELIKNVEEYFDIIEVSGHPFGFLPISLCFHVGIIGKIKKKL